MMNFTVRVWSLDKRPINHWMMAASNDVSDTLTISANWYKERFWSKPQMLDVRNSCVAKESYKSRKSFIYIYIKC